MIQLTVVRAGFQDLAVDDRPRRALRFGLVEGGPLDPTALRWANHLVGNPPGACGLECVGRGPVLRAEGGPVRVALVGGLRLEVGGVPQPPDAAVEVPPGSAVAVEAEPPALRAWLAVAGGLALPLVFGSRGVDRPGRLPGLAGRQLAAGDGLPVGAATGERAPRATPPRWRPAPGSGAWPVAVLPGAQWDTVSPDQRRHLLAQPYTVSPTSDRAGLRLLGAPVPAVSTPTRPGTMLSEGTAWGAVQLTPEGLPIVLLADRGSMGGYAKPLQVAAVDCWRLAQARPGTVLRFRLTTRAAAWRRLSRAWPVPA